MKFHLLRPGSMGGLLSMIVSALALTACQNETLDSGDDSDRGISKAKLTACYDTKGKDGLKCKEPELDENGNVNTDPCDPDDDGEDEPFVCADSDEDGDALPEDESKEDLDDDGIACDQDDDDDGDGVQDSEDQDDDDDSVPDEVDCDQVDDKQDDGDDQDDDEQDDGDDQDDDEQDEDKESPADSCKDACDDKSLI